MKRWAIGILITVWILCFWVTAAFAANSATIAWDAPADTSAITGYKLYRGLASGSYGAGLDAKTALQYTVTLLLNLGPVYFAATSYNAGQESAFSAELVCWSIAITADSGATVPQTGTIWFGQNSTASFTITPALGYLIKDVVADGISKGPATTFTFYSLAANHTLSVVTERKLTPPNNPHVIPPGWYK